MTTQEEFEYFVKPFRTEVHSYYELYATYKFRRKRMTMLKRNLKEKKLRQIVMDAPPTIFDFVSAPVSDMNHYAIC